MNLDKEVKNILEDLTDRWKLTEVYKRLIVLTNLRLHLVEKFELSEGSKAAVFQAKNELSKIKEAEVKFKETICEYISKHD